MQGPYKGVKGVGGKGRGYMGGQRRYKGVEGICIEGHGDTWENKDDTRE